MLKYMRKFYLLIQKGQTVSAQLTWSHYVELLKIDNLNEIKYYVYITEKQNLSVRELREKIKLNEYARIGYKEELTKPKINTLIKNPIVIRNRPKDEKLTEYALHNLILEDLDFFLKELGEGYMYVGHEYKIKIGNNYHYIDFLLCNINFNCYVVVEIKINDFHENYIGQIKKYMSYIDTEIKGINQNKTIGIIICKTNDGFVLNYINPDDIFVTTYKFPNKKVKL